MSRIFYSAGRRGFFHAATHALPDDAVPVTPARHRELLAAQDSGAEIVPNERGNPVMARERLNADGRRAAAVAGVKTEAARRILRVSPEHRQANDAADLALAAYQLAASGATTIDVAPALARRAAIDALRARSGGIEAKVAALPAAEIDAFDPAADNHWN